jgi:hypothetical protein
VSGDLPGREKWFRFLAGEDVGPMVSPLCCEWHFREPYRWPFDHPEPFPEGHAHRMVTEQLASAGVCGWDPTFLFYAHQATCRIWFKRLESMRKAGVDYLFYCVSGTEWISPDFFRKYILENTRKAFARWHELGGFILWHSCGKVKKFVEDGFFNELKPDVLETLSEPPVGDLPDIGWARQHLDPAIATKGNVPLDVFLNGTPEAVREQVRRVKDATRGYRHVVGLSDDLLRGTPIANALALVEEGRGE